jgi:hypothetical protein
MPSCPQAREIEIAHMSTCCLRFKNGVATIPATLASGRLARLYREGVENRPGAKGASQKRLRSGLGGLRPEPDARLRSNDQAAYIAIILGGCAVLIQVVARYPAQFSEKL